MNQVMQTSLEEKKQIVNPDIRICVNCGSISVQIENFGIYCKECKMFFDVKEDRK